MAAVCSKAVILLLVSLFNVALAVCGGGSSRLVLLCILSCLSNISLSKGELLADCYAKYFLVFYVCSFVCV